MTERQEQLLKLVVENYISSAEPVSSSRLVELSHLGISSATIRNELSMLEEAGYLMSPHTSAGRMPTDKGYRYYIETFVTNREGAKKKRQLEQLKSEKDHELYQRRIAKRISELTGDAVVLVSGPRRAYTTGVYRMFAKPEFHDLDEVMRISEIVDHMERVYAPMLKNPFRDVRIMIGDESPFGQRMSSMTIHYANRSGGRGMMSVIGPTRMNYERNLLLLREAQKLLSEI
ncbi:hypothetical protein HOI83_02275 [Candidatus Uhrbacteria bacterium]|jgi:transcriptional regulator of heat shock response|nr:hypothetical protein [Candidatus Uhrbacteria bacterium]